MASRYETRYIAENTNPLYDEFFKDRGVRGVVQYRSPQLLHPTPEQIANLSIVDY